jgi:hypothetical protein
MTTVKAVRPGALSRLSAVTRRALRGRPFLEGDSHTAAQSEGRPLQQVLSGTHRTHPLVVLGLIGSDGAQRPEALLRSEGAMVYVAHGAQACLRVSASISPDVVLLDPRFPPQMEALLRAHPSCADASIVRSPLLGTHANADLPTAAGRHT